MNGQCRGPTPNPGRYVSVSQIRSHTYRKHPRSSVLRQGKRKNYLRSSIKVSAPAGSSAVAQFLPHCVRLPQGAK